MTKKTAAAPTPATDEIKPAIEIKTWEGADEIGHNLYLVDLERERLENESEEKKRQIDLQYADQIKAKLIEKARLEFALVTFAQAHGDEITGLKRELRYIDIVKSKPTPFVHFLEDIAEIVRRLKRSPKWRSLLTTPEPTVSKTDLKKIPESERERFGFEVATRDPVYSVDIKRDRAQLYTKEQGR